MERILICTVFLLSLTTIHHTSPLTESDTDRYGGGQGGMSGCVPNCTCATGFIDCVATGVYTFPPHSVQGSVLNLSYNNITHLDLAILQQWPDLTRLHLTHNTIKSIQGADLTVSLEHLDLSYNYLQVLHAFVFTQIPSLVFLNISHNSIHTISAQTFYLPTLHTLDISYNQIQELSVDLLQSFNNLRRLFFRANRLSRLLDGSLSHIDDFQLLDFSHNFLMDIEEDTLLGINITHLDLGSNSFRKVPSLALSKLRQATTLVLDGLLMESLDKDAITNIPVKFLSISNCPLLSRLFEDSITNLVDLETVTINRNPKLVYFHPGGVSRVPNLLVMELTHNNLSALEDVQPYIPSLRDLYLKGNDFRCHCGLNWLQSAIAKQNYGFTIEDGAKIRCDGQQLVDVDLNSEECQPYILPLFPENWNQSIGKDVTWLCEYVSNSDTLSRWILADGQELQEGQCKDRMCVQDGSLTIRCLHPQDQGTYSCLADNLHGTDVRNVQLNVQMLHIQIFPLTIADTFITISWNTSKSLARDFILRIHDLENPGHIFEMGNIESSLKMSSYTIPDLKPNHAYKVALCLNKNNFKIEVSSTQVQTKHENFMNGLGIVTDYTSIAIVSLVLVLMSGSCIILSGVRIYKIRCMVETDSASIKPMVGSASDYSSMGVTPAEFDREKSKLMENEITLGNGDDLNTMDLVRI